MGSLAATAAMGVVALLALAGRFDVALVRLVDVHAATGIVGAMRGLVAVILTCVNGAGPRRN
ncbi:MAG TPA: hypothetical protein VGD42_20595 [Lysobacter sp.]